MIFIKVFQKLSQFSGNVPLEHWVSRMAVNTCLNQIESEKVRPELRHADLSVEQQAVIENLASSSDELAPDQRFASRQLVEHLLAGLKPVERLAIDLLYLQGRSVEEIRKITNDLNNYLEASVTSDGKTIATTGKDGTVGLATADFTQPGVLTRYVDLNLHTELQRGLEPAYDFWAQRFRVGTPIRFGRTATIIPSLNLELYELTGQVSQADPATGSVLLLRTCPGDPCVLSYFEQRVAWDGRDDPVNTRKGIYVSFSLQEGTNISGFGYRYLRVLPEARVFLPIFKSTVLGARLRFGTLRSLDAGEYESALGHFQDAMEKSAKRSLTAIFEKWVCEGASCLPR